MSTPSRFRWQTTRSLRRELPEKRTVLRCEHQSLRVSTTVCKTVQQGGAAWRADAPMRAPADAIDAWMAIHFDHIIYLYCTIGIIPFAAASLCWYLLQCNNHGAQQKKAAIRNWHSIQKCPRVSTVCSHPGEIYSWIRTKCPTLSSDKQNMHKLANTMHIHDQRDRKFWFDR